MVKKLSKKALTTIQEIKVTTSAAVKKARAASTDSIREAAGIENVDALKQKGREILSEIVKMDASGKMVNPIDRAISEAVLANADAVRKQVIKLVKQKGDKATPLDYYKIYHGVLKDSGLAPTIEPKLLGMLEEYRAGMENVKKKPRRPRGGGPACGVCNLCSACAACAACSLCTISAVGGTVGTGVVGATAGTTGLFI